MSPGNRWRWRRSFHRGVALGLTIVLHLVLVVVITRPVAVEDNQDNVQPQRQQALRLRFIPSLKSSPLPRLLAMNVRAGVVRPRRVNPTIALSKPILSKATVIPVTTTPVSEPAMPLARSVDPVVSDADGGFAGQLRAAQRAHAVGALPGADTPRVGGIQLIDPKTQGVGAVMRQAQRLFGITNQHCVDANTWRSMTPQELLARHITPSDVDKIDAENQCNRPMGLSF